MVNKVEKPHFSLQSLHCEQQPYGRLWFTLISIIVSPSLAPASAVAWRGSSGSHPVSLCTGATHHGELNGYGDAYSLLRAADYETL